MPEGKTHDGAAVKARDGKQNKNRAWNRTYPIGQSSTIDPALPDRFLPRLTATFGGSLPRDSL